MVHPYHGILLSNKKEQTMDTRNNLDKSPGSYAVWRKPIPKDYILHGSIYVIFLKWQNYRNREQSSGWPGFKEWVRVEGSRCGYKSAMWRIMEMLCMSIVSMSISWFLCCNIVLQDVTFEGKGVMGTWDLTALFLTTACESTIISKFKKFN